MPRPGSTASATVDVGPDADVPAFIAGVRAALDRADALVAVFAPALATPGDDYAQALAEIAASSRVPVLTTVPRHRGRAGAAAPLARRPGQARRCQGRCRRTRHRSGRCGRWRPRSRYAEWRRRPRRRAARWTASTPARRRVLVEGVLATARGRDRQRRWQELQRPAAGRVWRCRWSGWRRSSAAAGRGGGRRGRASWLPGRGEGDRAGAAAPAGPRRGPARPRPTRPCGRRSPRWPSVDRLGAPVMVQRMAAPGWPRSSRCSTTRPSARSCSFGVGGLATELLGDRAYAPVPMTDADAAELVAAPRAAPLLAGYRGSEPVDTGALQTCCCGSRGWPRTCPRCWASSSTRCWWHGAASRCSARPSVLGRRPPGRSGPRRLQA